MFGIIKQRLFGKLINNSECFMSPKDFSIENFKRNFADLEEKEVIVDLEYKKTIQKELFGFLDEWL